MKPDRLELLMGCYLEWFAHGEPLWIPKTTYYGRNLSGARAPLAAIKELVSLGYVEACTARLSWLGGFEVKDTNRREGVKGYGVPPRTHGDSWYILYITPQGVDVAKGASR